MRPRTHTTLTHAVVREPCRGGSPWRPISGSSRLLGHRMRLGCVETLLHTDSPRPSCVLVAWWPALPFGPMWGGVCVHSSRNEAYFIRSATTCSVSGHSVSHECCCIVCVVRAYVRMCSCGEAEFSVLLRVASPTTAKQRDLLNDTHAHLAEGGLSLSLLIVAYVCRYSNPLNRTLKYFNEMCDKDVVRRSPYTHSHAPLMQDRQQSQQPQSA